MTSQLEAEIIGYIRSNRISTTEVADALGKKGALVGLQPVNRGKHCVGKIFGIVAVGGSNYFVHKAISSVKPGEVVLITSQGFVDEAIIGDLISRSLLLYSGAEAIVVDGNVRDYARLIREDYAIWAKGSNPIGAVNNMVGAEEESKYFGGIAVCDDGGVVVISKEELTQEFLRKLQDIEQQEDIWYFCLNTLKWTTFDIVCLRRYESEMTELPRSMKNFKKSLND